MRKRRHHVWNNPYRSDNLGRKKKIACFCCSIIFVLLLLSSIWYCRKVKEKGSQPSSSSGLTVLGRQSLQQQTTTTNAASQFFSLRTDRHLILRPGKNGLNNQLQCLTIAANLAIAYNRTLILPPNAYTGSYHDETPIAFDKLFDVQNVRLSIQFNNDESWESSDSIELNFDPETISKPDILMDPHPQTHTLIFPCSYGDLRHSLPPNAPHRDETLLPWNPLYRKLANRVIRSIESKLTPLQTMYHPESSTTHNLRLLGLHLRRGDLLAYPLLSCSKTRYTHRSTFREGGWWLSACCHQFVNVTCHDPLSWEKLLEHLRLGNQPGIPSLHQDYDAIFVATNDVNYVRSFHVPNLYTLDDFSFVRSSLVVAGYNESPLYEFLVEEMVLVLSQTYIPSAPSSVTDILLQMRLQEHNRDEMDTHLYETYSQVLSDLKVARGGDIINWEKLLELLTPKIE
jgi:GDP-fucose protein O-fucosyltransferase